MTLPPFAIDGGLPLAVARGLAVAGLFSVFGTALARVAVMPPALALAQAATGPEALRRWRRLMASSIALAGLGLAGWIWTTAGTLAAAPGAGAIARTAWILLAATTFGHAWLLQLGSLVVVAAAVGRGYERTALVLAGFAVALESLHSHAFGMTAGPSWLLLSVLLHLLAGAAWLGGLLPLLIVVRTLPPSAAAVACRRFSPLGTACVLTLVASAVAQFRVLVGGLPGLLGTGYGLMALLKAALFALLLGFAVVNRQHLTPALAASAPGQARRRMVRSLAGETVVGLLIVLAAGVLSSLPPAMHIQPVWPLPVRPSLAIVRTDAAARWQAIGAALAIGCAILLGLWAVLVRVRWRWPTVVLALLVVALAAPRLDVLFVPAVPTSFQHSPTGFAASGIVRGAHLFAANCASCHGADGRGDGPGARGLAVAPGDLRAARVLDYGDGRMIWWLSHGIRAPAGDGLAMPGFAAKLSNRQQWDLIDYVRAHALGTLRAAAAWSVRARAPGFEATCPDGRTITLAGLRGRIVRLIVDGSAAASARPDGPASLITIIAASGPRAAGDVCVAHDESVPSAYAIVAGLPPDGVTGAEFLIDGHGWLRAVQTPGTRPGWDDAGVLARDVATIRAHPIAAGGGGGAVQMNMRMKM